MGTDALSRNVFLALLEVKPYLLERIINKQREDQRLMEIIKGIEEDRDSSFKTDEQGVLRKNGRICVPNINDLRLKVLEECHKSKLSIHPGVSKMHLDMKQVFW